MSRIAQRLIAKNKETKSPILDLGFCGLINELPEELFECVWLKGLNLGRVYVNEETKEWFESKNNGTQNIFTGNELKELSKLVNLRGLYLGSTEISDFSFLSQFTNLQSLDLSWNQIEDVSFLENLTQLQGLYLGSNIIKDISFLQNLKQLKKLFLDNNQIQEISFLCNSTSEYQLIIDNNPFEAKYNLSLAPFENHWHIIKNIRDREKEISETYNITFPVKIILLGNHASGKSSLLHYLLNSDLDYPENSTHLLNIEPYLQKREMPEALFFDFGGQDYYHGIYRAFLSVGSIYLLLWDKKTNKNLRGYDKNKIPIQNFSLSYWLALKNYHLKDSEDSIFIIQTHAKQNEKPEYHDIPFDKLVDNLFYVSLHNNFNPLSNQQALTYLQTCIDELIELLQKERQRKEPKWYIVFFEYILSKKGQDSTTLQELLPIYTPQDKSYEERLNSLRVELKQFHNQGLVLYYQNINKDKVWLNPVSIVSHIHTTILKKELLTQFKGIVPKKEFDTIDSEILLLLKEQKVIFEHETKEYIIPNFLPLAQDNQSEYDLFTFGLINPDFTLSFTSFLPIGLINQLICFFGRQPDFKKFWRDQLLFTFEGKHKILINLNFELLEIRVFVSSIDINKAEKYQLTHYLFYVIMAMYWDLKPLEYDELSNSKSASEELKIKKEQYNELFEGKRFIFDDLYISVDTKHFVKFTDLSEQNESERIIVSYCLEGTDILDKKSKLIPVKPFEVFTNKRFGSMKKIFISYSKFDEDYKNELQEHMVNLKRENLVEVFDDRQLELGSKWDDVLKQKIDECDYFICLVSRSFLNVTYIYQEEMPRAFKEGKKIIPIIIKPCDWVHTPINNFNDTDESPPRLGHINAHNKGKVIGLNDNYVNQNGKIEIRAFTEIERDAMWLEVVNKIRALIKNDS